MSVPRLGVGIGWRSEIDLAVERMPGIDFVEVVAEGLRPDDLPESVRLLRACGTPVLPHAVSLSLGGAEEPDPDRLARLARLAEVLEAPLVSDHVAFTRAGGLDAGHLLPVPRTREALTVLCDNVRIAQRELPVPLALENIARLIDWPDAELSEAEFLAELTERTGCLLVVDVANLHANSRNNGPAVSDVLAGLPWERLAYVHVAGGREVDGRYVDTHAHPVTPEVLEVLAELCSHVRPPGVLLERDDNFPAADELAAEIAAIRGIVGE